MTTLPFRPGRDFAILRREMDRLFDSTMNQDESPQTVWSPRADLVETDDAYVLSLDLPGIDRDTLDVTIDDGTLKVSGERRHTAEHADGRVHRVERAHGRFFRSFTLGTDLDDEGVEATFDDGVLVIRVAKVEQRQPRRIEVGSRTGRIEQAEVVGESSSADGDEPSDG